MAVLVKVLNPFNPNEKDVSTIDGGLAIFHLLNNESEDVEYVVSLNGKITEDYSYIIKQDDSIGIVPIPKGGGGSGKQILTIVAMIALTIAAPYAGVAMLNALGATTALSYGAAMGIMYGTQMAVMVAGGMLISALTPTPSATTPTNSTLNEVSPTYAFSGGSNAREAGATLPIILGKSRVTPPIIGSYVSLDGDKQYLNVLMAVSEGEVDSITDIQINGQDMDNFNAITRDDARSRGTETTFTLQRTLNENGSETTYTTAGNTIDELEIVVAFSSGLFEIKDSGDYISKPFTFDISIKPTSSTEWNTQRKTITSVYKTTKRLAYTFGGLNKEEYDVKIKRITPYDTNTRVANSFQLDYVNEIVYDEFTYPNVALLNINAMATDQLSGSFPQITCLVEKTTYKIESTQESISLSNPAWASYSLLKRNNIPDEDIDLDKFQEWADYCDEEEFEVGLYLDSQQELQSALNMISLLGRAVVVQMGSTFTPIVDMPVAIPTQSFLFTSGNIQDGSFQLSYVPYNDRSNTIEITYYDRDNNYEAKTAQLQSHDFDSTTPEIKSSISLYGCTKREQALRYAQSLLNKNRYLSEMVSFTADIDSIACGVGEVIKVGVQHMTNTMASGRLANVENGFIQLDQEVSLKQDELYEIQVRDEDDEINIYDYVHTSADEATDTLFVSNTLNVTNPKNVVFAFGTQSTEATNLYRVTSITRVNDFSRKITALEYNASVYDDDATIQIEEVTFSKAVENLKAEIFLVKKEGNIPDVVLNIRWSGNKLNYNVYYKKKSESNYKLYTSTSDTYLNMKELDYGETYDIKVEDEELQVVYKDLTVPPDIDDFTISGADKEMKTLNFSLSSKPIDFKGYELRYQLGDYPYWETATPLTDEVITASPYSTSLISTKGKYTLMIKAVDLFGNYSKNASSIVFDQASSYYQNLVFSEDFKELGWTGDKTNCSIIDGYLEATTPNADNTYTMEYQDLFYPDVGELAKITYEGEGSPQIYYRAIGELPYYDGGNAFIPDTEYAFREPIQNTWQLYTTSGFQTLANVPYQVKIVYIDSIVKPIVREFKVEVDATDLFEYQDDVEIPSVGLRIYSKNINSVKWVGTVLQDTGTGAISANYVKYNDGAFIKCYDQSGTPTAGLVDILLKGYANG